MTKESHVELPPGFKRNEVKRNLADIQYLRLDHIPITNYELRITNQESRIKNNVFDDWIKPCLITAGIGLTVYGLYRIRGR
ncbi:MAG: hypothetical protein HQ568_06250 [Calditrichaeota bacterium]|nr:hypothetical protein [Calditrichota bacterium]